MAGKSDSMDADGVSRAADLVRPQDLSERYPNGFAHRPLTGRADERIVRRQRTRGGAAGTGADEGQRAAGRSDNLTTLRDQLAAHPLDQEFWLNVANAVLHQGHELTKEQVDMLATCSDQANKSKLMSTKGLVGDPLEEMRSQVHDFLTGGHNGKA